MHAIGASVQNLLADYYWIQTVQALGRARTAEEYRDIYDYAELVTDLDPQFEYVYRFAGVSIPHNLGRETWVNTEESTKLLEKGVERFPQNVQLHIFLAYNYSYYSQDYRAAAHVLSRASRLPNAPPYLALLATRLYSAAGDFDVARTLVQQAQAESDDPELRAYFETREKQIELERTLQEVDRAIAVFRKREDRLPKSLGELIAAGDYTGSRTLEFGGDILIDENGQAAAAAVPERFKLYGHQDDPS